MEKTNVKQQEVKSFKWYNVKTIRGKIILFSIFMILFMVGIVAISSYMQSQAREKTQKTIDLRIPNMTISSAAEAHVIETALFIRHVMLTQKEEINERRKKIWENDVKEHMDYLNANKKFFTNPKNVLLVDSITESLVVIRDLQEKIAESVFSFKSIENPSDSLKAATKKTQMALLAEITPTFLTIRRQLGEFAESQRELLMNDIKEAAAVAEEQKIGNAILLLVAVVLAIALSFWIVRSIINPITTLHGLMLQLSKGHLPENLKEEDNEIGEMVKASNTLVNGLRVTTNFANEIGNGSFESDFTPLSQDDVLGKSLLTMRDNLKSAALEEQKRAWATEGMAKFGEILRATGDGMAALGDNIISNLVKYLNANQGGLFVVNDANPNDTYLELIACYAWNKKKFINMRVDVGDGLVGQAYQEKDMLYITDVPKDFVRITSGLGDANPNAFLIVPLTVNDETYGVIEIASFHLFEEHQKEFVKKLAESIASTLSTAKINERTKVLLEQSQQQTEEMRAQEEEMRQNMEEMQATQEEMERKEVEMKKMVEEMQSIQAEVKSQTDIVNSIAIVSKTDLKGNITYVNDEFLKWSKYSMQELMGKNHRMLKSGDQDDQIFVDMWKTISSGKIFRGEIKNKAKDGSFYWVDAIVAPILDENGKPKEYIAQRFVINEQKRKEQEMQAMLEETRAQEEEKRQNMEELQAIQEQSELTSLEMEGQLNIINNAAIVSKTDLRGNITYVNDMFCKYAKYTREELMGKPHNIVRHPDMPVEAFADLWKTISSGKVWKGEVKNKAKDGTHYWVSATISPILDKSGKPKEYMAVRYVITDAKNNIDNLNKTIAELEQQLSKNKK